MSCEQILLQHPAPQGPINNLILGLTVHCESPPSQYKVNLDQSKLSSPEEAVVSFDNCLGAAVVQWNHACFGV
ncbi:hypothetical protein E2C01_052817 [Portunus trituberculatus]|uniref:Uncharacterized protein n=1 Tax=Portunus trituberculatus TaxID=210409 RepID=A0A5B7GP82_PORTR|nr:hypothetical protein [Portunus trituberculatus]